MLAAIGEFMILAFIFLMLDTWKEETREDAKREATNRHERGFNYHDKWMP